MSSRLQPGEGTLEGERQTKRGKHGMVRTRNEGQRLRKAKKRRVRYTMDGEVNDNFFVENFATDFEDDGVVEEEEPSQRSDHPLVKQQSQKVAEEEKKDEVEGKIKKARKRE